MEKRSETDKAKNLPFVFLFTEQGHYYVYDVNQNQVIEIPVAVYNYMNGDAKTTLQIEEYVDGLKKEGYLKTNRVQMVEHPMTELASFYLNSKLNHMILQLTQNCNLRCEYCVYSGGYHNRSHTNKKMSFETAKKSIDFLVKHSKDTLKLSLSFYGGEPLLEYSLLQECILYAEKRALGKEILFNFTTNGTLLTEDKFEFLKNHDVQIMISLDGPQKVHDKRRKYARSKKGSFDVIIKNITKLKKYDPKYYKNNVKFNTVFDAENSFSIISEFFRREQLLNDNKCFATFINEDYSLEEHSVGDQFIAEYRYEMFKFFLYKCGRLKKENVSKLIFESINSSDMWKQLDKNVIMKQLPFKFHRGGPCLPGGKRLFVSCEGDFFTCERVSESTDVAKIGDIDNGFDMNKVSQLLNIERFSEEQCRNCWAYHYCNICVAKADDGEKISLDTISKKCKQLLEMREDDLRNYCVLKTVMNR